MEVDGTGGAAGKVAAVMLDGIDPRLKDVEILVACDVDNPLCGEKGASAVFGPQKGATPETVRVLDANLKSYADAVERSTGKYIQDEPGMGAAGGLGFSVLQFCKAKTGRGVEIVLDAIQFDHYAEWADIIITGEGRVDFQTPFGKAPAGVARHAAKYGKPVYAIAGFEGKGAQAIYECGIIEVVSAVYAPCTIDEAIASSDVNIPRAAERLMRIIKPFIKD
jgi:glycerate 2-kinase